MSMSRTLSFLSSYSHFSGIFEGTGLRLRLIRLVNSTRNNPRAVTHAPPVVVAHVIPTRSLRLSVTPRCPIGRHQRRALASRLDEALCLQYAFSHNVSFKIHKRNFNFIFKNKFQYLNNFEIMFWNYIIQFEYLSCRASVKS